MGGGFGLGSRWGGGGVQDSRQSEYGCSSSQQLCVGSLFNGKSVVSVLTGWCAQRPSGRCAGSGPETAASAYSSSLVLWIGASLCHLGIKKEKWLSLQSVLPKPVGCQRHSVQCNVVCFFSKWYMATMGGLPAEQSGQLAWAPRRGGAQKAKDCLRGNYFVVTSFIVNQPKTQ